jgi:hypothetical protein
MKVICKHDLISNKGSFNESKCLTIGKEYEALSISYHANGVWIDKNIKDIKYIPKEPKFYIKIKEDDNEKTHDIWNAYFLSTEEYRDYLINKLEL